MTSNLRKALTALETLPVQSQDAIAAGLMEEVSSLQQSSLTPEQSAVLDARLAQPMVLASADEVAAVFNKY